MTAAVPAGDPGALLDRLEEELRESLAFSLRTHGQADYDPQTGTRDCRCGQFSGGFLSYHQADALIAHSPALADLIRLARDGLALRDAHGPSKCVPVAEANRVLAEERARLEGALSRAVVADTTGAASR